MLSTHNDLRRLIHIVAPAEMGGLARDVQSLTIGLNVAGYETHLAVVLDERYPEHWLVTAAQVAGVVTHPLILRARAYHAERRAIADLCRRVRPDVVHTHGYRADLVDAGVARAQGIPTVGTAYGLAGRGWKDRVYEGLQWRAFRRFDAVIAESVAVAGQLVRWGVPVQRIHVVPKLAPAEWLRRHEEIYALVRDCVPAAVAS